jgi:chromate transporter
MVMAQAAAAGWVAMAVTAAAALAMLTTRINPLWLLAAGGVLGGLGIFS